MRFMTSATILLPAILWALPQTSQGQGVSQLWRENCQSCHADNGRGANAASLLDDEWLGGSTDRDLYNAIAEGMPDSGMPGYAETMTPEQMWALVVYTRELRHRADPNAGAPKKQRGGTYATQHHDYKLERVVTRDLDIPWSIDFLPDGRMLVAERPGRLRLYDDGKPSPPVRGVPKVQHRGQGGLMDVAPHPDFENNQWLYISYSDPGERRNESMTRIIRARLVEEGGRPSLVDEEIIFAAAPEHYDRSSLHFGCRLVFDDAGHLFFCIGERGRAQLAQDLGRPNGKIFRVNLDGSVPEDNPFIEASGTYPQIWSYGHRNPQGLVWDPATKTLWDTEHGPRGGDEVNQIVRGANYGWPIISYGINYNGAPYRVPWVDVLDRKPAAELRMPEYHWLPSIAVCGLDIYRADAFPAWDGDLLAGGLAGQVVDRVRIRDGKMVEREPILLNQGRVRDVIVGPDGAVYVALNDPDHVVRLVPTD